MDNTAQLIGEFKESYKELYNSYAKLPTRALLTQLKKENRNACDCIQGAEMSPDDLLYHLDLISVIDATIKTRTIPDFFNIKKEKQEELQNILQNYDYKVVRETREDLEKDIALIDNYIDEALKAISH